jgi:hypothetical protein
MLIEDVFYLIYNYLTSQEFLLLARKTLLIFKVTAAVYIVLLIINIVLLGVKMNFYKNFVLQSYHGGTYKRKPLGKVKKIWETVEKRMRAHSESNYKLAVIEADKLLDMILEISEFPGKTMGERLKKVNTGQIPNLDEIWKCHKIRNNIVHDTDFTINQTEAQKCVDEYKKALIALEVL